MTPIFPYRKALFADARPVLASGPPYFSVDQGLQLGIAAGWQVVIDFLGINVQVQAAATLSWTLYQSTGLPPVSLASPLSVSPSTATLVPGASQQFSAPGATGAVTWTLAGAAGDRITSAGLFTAAAPAGRQVVVTATDSTGATGTAVVTIGPGIGPPQSLAGIVNASGTAASLTWKPPVAVTRETIASYSVNTSPATALTSVAGTATGISITGLTPGITYVVSVSAWTTSGFESSPATLILSTARFPTFPTVTSINPSQGPDAGGTNVTIRGSGFSPKPERTVFNFGPGRAVRDVSCSSSTTCTASTPPASVGSIDVTATVNGESSTPNPPGDEFSYVGSPGGVWTPVQALLPKGGKPPANLHAVACWSATACVATGGYYDSSGVFQGLIESLSGGAWIPTKAPLPRGVADDLNVYLAGVACPAPGWCVVTGSYGVGTGAVGLIETLTGGLWTAAEAPLPRGAANNAIVGLRALTCPSTSSCVATGDYVDSSNHGQGLIESFSGGTWTATKAPLSPGAASDPEAGLGALTCPSTSSCVATGDYVDSSNHGQGLIESFSGGTWTPTEAPLPVGVDGASSDPEAQIESVVCASTSTCVATGDYLDADGDELGVIETLSSATWKPTEAIVPTFPSFDLGPVACPSTSSCVAVGDYNALPGDEGFFETLSDGTWRPTEAPLPTGASSVLANVSLAFVACASTSSCVAGGHYFDTNGDEQGLIEMLTEGIWKPTEAPLPADVGSSPEAELRSVACFDATACVAVGTYRDSNGNQQDLIEQTG